MRKLLKNKPNESLNLTLLHGYEAFAVYGYRYVYGVLEIVEK